MSATKMPRRNESTSEDRQSNILNFIEEQDKLIDILNEKIKNLNYIVANQNIEIKILSTRLEIYETASTPSSSQRSNNSLLPELNFSLDVIEID
jgi:hypothetical protein